MVNGVVHVTLRDVIATVVVWFLAGRWFAGRGVVALFRFANAVSLFLLFLLAFLTPAHRVIASDIELLVPAYGNPCCGDGPFMWGALVGAAEDSNIRISIILNPASGPGASPIDPNYINPFGTDPLLDFKAAGGVVYGYVPTTFGERNIVDVKADVDTYYDPAYWRGSGVQVDGIFFDEMSNDLADVGYYQQLSDYVNSREPAAKVIANPGTTFTNNPSGQTTFSVMDYVQTADTLLTFDASGNDYRNNYTAPSWLNDFSADHFAHVIHSETSSANMLIDVELARARKAGMIYITDDVLPNPYDSLASYWNSELGAIEAHGNLEGQSDHFLGYRVTKTSGTLNKLKVSLADQFETGLFKIRRIKSLYNPANINNEGIGDQDSHLVGYRIRAVNGEPRHKAVIGIGVVNQFHSVTPLLVDTVAPYLLLVPSLIDLDSLANIENLPANGFSINHFKCYKVNLSNVAGNEFPNYIQVTAVDQFNQPKLYDVKEPKSLCTPVNKNGEGILTPENHLMCYKVAPAQNEPSHIKELGIHINNQVGPLQLNSEKDNKLCVPSNVIVP